jgi:hypothetical protein
MIGVAVVDVVFLGWIDGTRCTVPGVTVCRDESAPASSVASQGFVESVVVVVVNEGDALDVVTVIVETVSLGVPVVVVDRLFAVMVVVAVVMEGVFCTVDDQLAVVVAGWTFSL